MAAARYNTNKEVLKVLIGANVDAKGKDGWTTLMAAARDNSNPEVLGVLIGGGADVNAKNKDEWTPLMFAALQNSNPEALMVLIKAGADINAKNKDGSTPLMLAAYSEFNSNVLTALLEAGADAKVKDGKGKTAFDYAREHKKLKDTEALKLLEEKTGLSPTERGKLATEELLEINGKTEPEKVRQLIQDGADVNAKDEDGGTPLMIAAYNNSNPEVLTTLLEAGADVNAKNDGWTPLMFAAIKNTPEVLTALLEAGADAKAKNNHGGRALDYTRWNEKLKGTDALKLLEEKTGQN